MNHQRRVAHDGGDGESSITSATMLDGGVVALAIGKSGYIGVASLSDISCTISCSSVKCLHNGGVASRWDYDAAAAAAPSQNSRARDDSDVAPTSTTGFGGGEDDVDEAAASHYSKSFMWLKLLLKSFEVSRVTLLLPANFPTPLFQWLLSRDGSGGVVPPPTTVKVYHHTNNNTVGTSRGGGGGGASGEDVSRLLQQLQALWPRVSPSSWCARLRLLQCPEMVTSLCAVIDEAMRNQYPIMDIVERAPVSTVAVEDTTLSALRVFKSDHHPSAYLGIGGGCKEGYSLSAVLLEHCHTPMGRELLLQWLRCPIGDLVELQRRHGAVEWLAQPERSGALTQMIGFLKRVRNPGHCLRRIRVGSHSLSDYETVVASASALSQLCTMWSPAPVHARTHSTLPVPSFMSQWLCRFDVKALNDLVHYVQNVIDLSRHRAKRGGLASSGCATHSGSVTVLPGVDTELDELRTHCNQMSTYLTKVAEDLVMSLPPSLLSLKLACVSYPGVGYLVAVEKHSMGVGEDQPTTEEPEEGEVMRRFPQGWQLVFKTETHQYFRTAETCDLDTHVGDIHAALVARETKVLVAVDERILSLGAALLPAIHLAELDCFIALALAAVHGNWHRPAMIDSAGDDDDDDDGGAAGSAATASLRGATHPLLSRLASQPLVPLDITVSSHDGRLIILTGPNGSGKSVVLQTVTLCVYLAHVGSFVPCTSATISLIDSLTCISDDALVAAATPSAGGGARHHHTTTTSLVAAQCGGSSTFAMELLALSRALSSATPRSWIVLDEFARGTLALDGVALLASVFLSLCEAKTPSTPVLMLATHYTELLIPRLGLMKLRQVQHIAMEHAMFEATSGMAAQVDWDDDDDAGGDEEAAAPRRHHQRIAYPFRFVVTPGGVQQQGSASRMVVHPLGGAIECAHACGVPSYMVQRMLQLAESTVTTGG